MNRLPQTCPKCGGRLLINPGSKSYRCMQCGYTGQAETGANDSR